MAEKNNAKCSICGKDYVMCYTCNSKSGATPWKMHCDTAEHYKIYQIVHGYTSGLYDDEEAASRLELVDLSDYDSLRENIKGVIDKIRSSQVKAHDVNYSFKSGTDGHELPEGVLSKVPAKGSEEEGNTVTPIAVEGTVADGNGVWSFKEWQPKSAEMDSDGLDFVGVWEWKENPKHSVTYEFVSGTEDKPEVDALVMEMLPEASEAYDGTEVVPSPSTFEEVVASDGTWTFVSWSPDRDTMDESGVKFTGTWTFAPSE